jgi:hypothetical protein
LDAPDRAQIRQQRFLIVATEIRDRGKAFRKNEAAANYEPTAAKPGVEPKVRSIAD